MGNYIKNSPTLDVSNHPKKSKPVLKPVKFSPPLKPLPIGQHEWFLNHKMILRFAILPFFNEQEIAKFALISSAYNKTLDCNK